MKDDNSENVILGIDPGTNIMGYAVIKTGRKSDISVQTIGIVYLEKYDDIYMRLKIIYDKTLALITEYKPDVLAIEAPFYGKNVQSMLKLGRAQGTAIAASLQAGLKICEYSPKRIKQAITGRGNATKEQVAAILKNLLNIDCQETYDATDALAVAICHFYVNKKNFLQEKRFKNWDEYLKSYPNKLI